MMAYIILTCFYIRYSGFFTKRGNNIKGMALNVRGKINMLGNVESVEYVSKDSL